MPTPASIHFFTLVSHEFRDRLRLLTRRPREPLAMSGHHLE